MRGERILFYLAAAFICGNLITGQITSILGDFELLLLTQFAGFAIIALSLMLFMHIGESRLIALVALFMVGAMGVCIDSYSQTELRNSNMICKSSGVMLVKSESKLSIRMKEMQKDFDKVLSQIIDPSNVEEFTVLKALSVGEMKEIPPELKESFRVSGTMHLLALSGMHIGIIYGLLHLILSVFGQSTAMRITRSFIILALLWFYSLFTGMGTSIGRAVIMATVYEMSGMIYRNKNGFSSLAISALIITLSDSSAPSQIGFQLSFAAMLAIFTIFPLLQRMVVTDKLPKLLMKPCKYMWTVISMSLACQIFTAPLVYYHFGTFSYYSLIANVLTMPLTEAIMAFVTISMVGMKIPIIGDVSAKLLEWSIAVLNYIVTTISQLQ